jgi:transcriptional regulator with XRE-family HTH domain
MERDEFLIFLGSRIREIRKQKKITQEKLSDLCEFEKANLSRIETGLTNPTVLTLFKMSKALQVDLTEFFTGK